MVSIIIPTKNEEAYLPTLLASISAQTMVPHEVIVCDAKSSDGTRHVAEAFGATVIDGGLPGVGRNHGAKKATGDVLLFLDADVVLPDADFLATCYQEFLRRGLSIATCDARPLEGNRRDRFTHALYNGFVHLCGKRLPHAAGFCIFVTAKLHKDIGGFDEQSVFCEDHEYARRAAKKGAFGFLSAPILVSTRRFRRDGYLLLFPKFVLAELYLVFIGPIHKNVFRYTFGHK